MVKVIWQLLFAGGVLGSFAFGLMAIGYFAGMADERGESAAHMGVVPLGAAVAAVVVAALAWSKLRRSSKRPPETRRGFPVRFGR